MNYIIDNLTELSWNYLNDDNSEHISGLERKQEEQTKYIYMLEKIKETIKTKMNDVRLLKSNSNLILLSEKLELYLLKH